MTWSKEYRSDYNKEYYLKRIGNIKKYYLKNREHLNTYMKEYHLKNKERTKEYYRGYYLKNKILILQKQKMYRADRCDTNIQ